MVLKLLEQRGSVTVEHRRAGERLERDYRASMTNPARLVSRYEANLPRAPKRYQGNADTPLSIAARCELNGERTHDRCVGVCYLGDVDIAAEMVRRLGIVRASAAGGIATRSSGPRRQAQQSGGRTHCRGTAVRDRPARDWARHLPRTGPGQTVACSIVLVCKIVSAALWRVGVARNREACQLY